MSAVLCRVNSNFEVFKFSIHRLFKPVVRTASLWISLASGPTLKRSCLVTQTTRLLGAPRIW